MEYIRTKLGSATYSCVTLDKMLNITVSWVVYLQKEDTEIQQGCWENSKGLMSIKIFLEMTPGTGRTTHSKYFCGPSDTPKSAGACVSCVCSAVQKTFWSQKSTSNSPLIFSPLSFGNSLLDPGCLQTNLLKMA